MVESDPEPEMGQGHVIININWFESYDVFVKAQFVTMLIFLCLLFMINTKKEKKPIILQYSNYFEKFSLSYALKSKNRFLYTKIDRYKNQDRNEK